MRILHPKAGKPLGEEGREQPLFLGIQPKDLALKLLHSAAFAFKGNDTNVGWGAVVARKIVEFVGLVEGHFAAFENKAVFVGGADHLAFVDVYHLPKIVPLALVAEVLGKLHVEKGNNAFYVKDLLKAYFCKIILHIFTPLPDFTLIISDFAFLCNSLFRYNKIIKINKEVFPMYTVLVLSCHPDDMEIACAGTLLKCKARGDRVVVCHLSSGNLGHVIIPPDELTEMRAIYVILKFI